MFSTHQQQKWESKNIMAKEPVSSGADTVDKSSSVKEIPQKWARLKAFDNRLAPLIKTIERSAIAQGLAMIAGVCAFVGLGLTVWAVSDEFDARQEEREQRRQERIERTWNRLLLPAIGNTRKGRAISDLLKEGETLNGIDLSCETMGGWTEDGKCGSRVILSDLEFAGGNSLEEIIIKTRENKRKSIVIDGSSQFINSAATMKSIKLNGIRIEQANINFAAFLGIDLRRAIINNSRLFSSIIFGNFDGLSIMSSQLTNTMFNMQGSMTISFSDVSNVRFQYDKERYANSAPVRLHRSATIAEAPPTCPKRNVFVHYGDLFAYQLKPAEPCPEEMMKTLAFCDKSPSSKKTKPNGICERHFRGSYEYAISYEEAKKRYPFAYISKEVVIETE